MNTQLNLPLLDARDLVECIDNALKKGNLSELEKSEILFDPEENLSPLNGWSSSRKINPISIERYDKKVSIASVDSSVIFLASTSSGSLYASKCGIAIAYDGKQLMHFKIGPSLFYINEKVGSLDHNMAKRMIRVRVERAIQSKLANTLSNTLILIDGTLKASIFEYENTLLGIFEGCRAHNNKIIGISKVSRLKIVERLVSLLSEDSCYIDISSILRSYINNLYGKQLLVRLSKDGLVLRADVIDESDLSLLISNDVLHNGYPQTLRLAHHLSIFTKTEILAMISIIASRFKTSEVNGCNLRSMLLGRIGVR